MLYVPFHHTIVPCLYALGAVPPELAASAMLPPVSAGTSPHATRPAGVTQSIQYLFTAEKRRTVRNSSRDCRDLTLDATSANLFRKMRSSDHCLHSGVDPGGWGSWPPVKILRRGHGMLWPLKMSHSFIQKLLLYNSASFTSSRMKDLCQKWQAKLIIQGAYRLSGTGLT